MKKTVLASTVLIGLVIFACVNPVEEEKSVAVAQTPAPTPKPTPSPTPEPSVIPFIPGVSATSTPPPTPSPSPSSPPPAPTPVPSPISWRLVAACPGGFQYDGTATNLLKITSTFIVSATEITRGQWKEVFPNDDPSAVGVSNSNEHPVNNVSWYAAIAYCNKLSLQHVPPLTPKYTVAGVNFSTLTFSGIPTVANATWEAATYNASATGYRLPTESEWMWAAMGARAPATGYSKLFSGAVDAYSSMRYSAWYVQYSDGVAHQVKTLDANELGIYDMSGNVWEWTWDWFSAYPAGSSSDYKGPATGTTKVAKGGAFNTIDAACAVAFRKQFNPEQANSSLGFRIVQD